MHVQGADQAAARVQDEQAVNLVLLHDLQRLSGQPIGRGEQHVDPQVLDNAGDLEAKMLRLAPRRIEQQIDLAADQAARVVRFGPGS